MAVENITALILQYYPKTPTFPVIGNNDVIPKNQMFDGPSATLQAFSQIWSRWLPRMSSHLYRLSTPFSLRNVAEEALNSLNQGGFYSVDVTPKLKIIGLNTLYYMTGWCPDNTTSCKKSYEPTSNDPAGQFRFFESQLQAAAATNQSYVSMARCLNDDGKSLC